MNYCYFLAEENDFPIEIEYEIKKRYKILFLTFEKYNEFLMDIIKEFSMLEKKEKKSFNDYFEKGTELKYEEYKKIVNSVSEEFLIKININGNDLLTLEARLNRSYNAYVEDIENYNKMIDLSKKVLETGLKNKEDLSYIFEHNNQISYWSKRKNIDIR